MVRLGYTPSVVLYKLYIILLVYPLLFPIFLYVNPLLILTFYASCPATSSTDGHVHIKFMSP